MSSVARASGPHAVAPSRELAGICHHRRGVVIQVGLLAAAGGTGMLAAAALFLFAVDNSAGGQRNRSEPTPPASAARHATSAKLVDPSAATSTDVPPEDACRSPNASAMRSRGIAVEQAVSSTAILSHAWRVSKDDAVAVKDPLEDAAVASRTGAVNRENSWPEEGAVPIRDESAADLDLHAREGSPADPTVGKLAADEENTTSESPPPGLAQRRVEQEFYDYLRTKVPRVQFDTKQQAAKRALWRTAEKEGRQSDFVAGEVPEAQRMLRRMVGMRADIEGLPFRWGDGCRSDAANAQLLAEISTAVRSVPGAPPPPEQAAESLYGKPSRRERALLELLDSHADWRTAEAVSALEQTLQVESPRVRIRLIEHLQATAGPEAGAALARRAIFDPERNVRYIATEALANRDPQHYQEILLAGLTYPWEEIVWNAVDALTIRYDARLIPQLLELLDQPSATAPFQDEQGQWRVRELVAVKHLHNCVLCHAPSTSQDDAVRGLVPNPNAPPPPTPSPYYGGPKLQGDFVRADTTYLRQHFSLVHKVDDHGKWPENQRVDYLVRERKLSLAERADLAQQEGQAKVQPSAHREAVAFLLRKMTGLSVEELRAIYKQQPEGKPEDRAEAVGPRVAAR